MGLLIRIHILAIVVIYKVERRPTTQYTFMFYNFIKLMNFVFLEHFSCLAAVNCLFSSPQQQQQNSNFGKTIISPFTL